MADRMPGPAGGDQPPVPDDPQPSEPGDLPGAEPSLGQQAAYELPQAECDMVMKGGITSGVVYPRAACRLATRYRFRRLGGASAGAIAATVVAAAEHGRATGGFVELEKLPTELGSKLSKLFQASPETKPAFAALSNFLEPNWSTGKKLSQTASLLIRSWPLGFLVALLVALLPALVVLLVGGASGLGRILLALAVWLLVAVPVALLMAAVVLGLRTLKALPGNGYGLCDGHTRDPAVGEPPLTDWMTTTLDQLAGPRGHSGPVTFGDLWGPDAVAQYRQALDPEEPESSLSELQQRELREARNIDVEVMTTNLTFRRPYGFPFDNRIFFFCPDCFSRYFPDPVVTQMVNTSLEVPDEEDGGRLISTVCPRHGTRVRNLPQTPDIPVVIAARLSLSFPGLISAVPFFCIDWNRAQGKRTLVEAWFSDGGISSNFPMHFFDAPWPARPTFGINLLPRHPDSDKMVWTPDPQGVGGILPRARPMGSMIGFLQSIMDTMQNWVDNVQITQPGYRDRIAEVRQRPEEGGMNLKMPAEVIEALADRGAEAAALFDVFSFDLHRWIRYRVAMSGMDDVVSSMLEEYKPGGYDTFIATYGKSTKRYRPGSPTADAAATAKLMDVAADWAKKGHPHNKGAVPRPRPELRIVPRQ